MDKWNFKLAKKEVGKVFDKRYQRIDELPGWAKPTIAKLVERKILEGIGDGNLNLSMDMIRVYVSLDKAGVYDN